MKITEKQFKDIIEEEIKKALLMEASPISFYQMIELAQPGDELSLKFQRDGYDWMMNIRDKPFKAGKTYKASVGKDGKILIFHETVGTFFNKWNESKKTKEDMIKTIKKNVETLTDEEPPAKGKKYGPCSILNCKKSIVTRKGAKASIWTIMKAPNALSPEKAEPKKAEPKKTKEYGDFSNLDEMPYLNKKTYSINDYKSTGTLGNILTRSKKRYAIVNFMSDGCKPCERELPHFKTFLLTKYGNNFDFYMINGTFSSPEAMGDYPNWIKENANIIPAAAKHFLMNMGINFSVPLTLVVDVRPADGGVHKGIMEIDGAFSSAELLTRELKKRIKLKPKKADPKKEVPPPAGKTGAKKPVAPVAPVTTKPVVIDPKKGWYVKSSDGAEIGQGRAHSIKELQGLVDNWLITGTKPAVVDAVTVSQDKKSWISISKLLAAAKAAVKPVAAPKAPPTAVAPKTAPKPAPVQAQQIQLVKNYPPESQGRQTGRVDLGQKCRYGPPPGKKGYEWQICKQGMVCIKRHDGKPVTYWSPTGRCKKPTAPAK